MAKRNTEQVDLINGPIPMARDWAFQQVQKMLKQSPNPLGEMRPGDIGRMTKEEQARLRGS